MKTIQISIGGETTEWVPKQKYLNAKEERDDLRKRIGRFDFATMAIGVVIGLTISALVVAFWDAAKKVKQREEEGYSTAWVPSPLNPSTVRTMMDNYVQARYGD